MSELPQIQVTSVKAQDQSLWRSLWSDYLKFYKVEKSEDVYAATWARLFDSNPRNVKGALAWLGNEAVGLVHWFDHTHSGYVDDVCYLQDLFVTPAARGHRVGQALIEHVYAYADSKNLPQVYWTTQSHNQTARRLYDRIADDIGFVKYASQRNL
jgi:ribosomal protein S18 acetylase RimI-like enzyme